MFEFEKMILLAIIVDQAVEELGQVDATSVYVPPPFTAAAIVEAAKAGIAEHDMVKVGWDNDNFRFIDDFVFLCF